MLTTACRTRPEWRSATRPTASVRSMSSTALRYTVLAVFRCGSAPIAATAPTALRSAHPAISCEARRTEVGSSLAIEVGTRGVNHGTGQLGSPIMLMPSDHADHLLGRS